MIIILKESDIIDKGLLKTLQSTIPSDMYDTVELIFIDYMFEAKSHLLDICYKYSDFRNANVCTIVISVANYSRSSAFNDEKLEYLERHPDLNKDVIMNMDKYKFLIQYIYEDYIKPEFQRKLKENYSESYIYDMATSDRIFLLKSVMIIYTQNYTASNDRVKIYFMPRKYPCMTYFIDLKQKKLYKGTSFGELESLKIPSVVLLD